MKNLNCINRSEDERLCPELMEEKDKKKYYNLVPQYVWMWDGW